MNLYDYGARFYDPALGRWHAYDALAEDVMQIDKSPYQYAWNTPVNLTDPDGNCPWCIGGVIGAVTEIGTQMVSNYVSGKDVTDIDWADVGVATVAGIATGGLSTYANIVKVAKGSIKVAKAVKKTGKIAAIAVEEGTKATIDYKTHDDKGFETVFNGKKTKTDAATDFVFGVGGGQVSKKAGELTGGLANTKATKQLKQVNNNVKKTAKGSQNNNYYKQEAKQIESDIQTTQNKANSLSTVTTGASSENSKDWVKKKLK